MAAELGLSRARFYELFTHYLHACAHGQADTWSPGCSGGDHQPDWPAEVSALLTLLLSSKPPSSYSACASELHRRLHFLTDRASVRRWALQNQLAPDTRYKPSPQPVKRWQTSAYGALWQYDASPHAWLPGSLDKQVLLDQLVPHANEHEIHRELGTTPHGAKAQALAEKRFVLRPAPACPWWPFVWSQQSRVRVGDDGKVPAGSQRHAIAAPPRATVICCLRPDGDIDYLLHAPNPKTKPLVLLHVPGF